MADHELNLARGVPSVNQDIYDLHVLAFILVSCIGVIVFGLMIWSIIYHRKSRGAVTSQFDHGSKREAIWAVIPILILLLFVAPATKMLVVHEAGSGQAEMTISVTAYQWRWHYQYEQEGFGFFSSLAPEHNEARQRGSEIDVSKIENYLLEVDNPLVVPVNTRIRVLYTSNDVIHAWWIPELGIKHDAVPGFVNTGLIQITEPGIYRGQCAELCGRDHAFMPVVVRAVPKPEFTQWVQHMQQTKAEVVTQRDRQWTMAELMDRGEAVYLSVCVSCHQADGQGLPPAFPALTSSTLAEVSITDHVSVVVNGRVGTSMPAFAGKLDDIDIAAVVTYGRNSWGNKAGDMIQPAMVNSERQ
ncbi:MAG: cytochrome c oxidase subunit II [Gammaproteobacteria bacterium]|nr:cytochrome c oxidase subunit II [Gammaproteobacteria bacterium]